MEDDSKLPAALTKQVEDYPGYGDTHHRDLGDSQEEDENVIHVVVKRTGMAESPCLELTIERDATVMNLKTLIQDELADESPCLMVPVERQRLIYQGRMLINNDHGLLDDVKMKPDKVNYVHLAPLPKGATPTLRKRNENKVVVSSSIHHPRHQQQQRLRSARRAQRAFTPYRISSVRNTLPDPAVVVSSSSATEGLRDLTTMNRLLCTGSRLSPQLTQMGLGSRLNAPSLAGLVHHSPALHHAETLLGGLPPPQELLGDATTAEVRDMSTILSLCHLLPSSLSQHLAPTSRGLYGAASADETIVLLDEMSQRCASLSSSLRANRSSNNTTTNTTSSINRPAAVAMGLQGIGLPLGYF